MQIQSCYFDDLNELVSSSSFELARTLPPEETRSREEGRKNPFRGRSFNTGTRKESPSLHLRSLFSLHHNLLMHTTQCAQCCLPWALALVSSYIFVYESPDNK
eukprot:scaffold32620_cov131-Skeletonema_menzelii.AAC.2